MNFYLVREGSRVPFGVALDADVVPTDTGYTVARMMGCFPDDLRYSGRNGPVLTLTQQIWKLRMDSTGDVDFCIRSWETGFVQDGQLILDNVTIEPYGDAWLRTKGDAT